MKNKQYFGLQTKQAVDNFPFDLPKVRLELIYSVTLIKKAAAKANQLTGDLDEQRSLAMIQVCEEILKSKLDDQFVTVSLQGGAGTSINMNVNEVIAARATEILKNKGRVINVHPNDHVNKAQSTNDVNPSALKICCLELVKKLITELEKLQQSFLKRAREYKNVKKLARTHLQDAIPTTFGEEFSSYASTVERDKQRIEEAEKYLHELNLGGTAIGNSINASKQYIEQVYKVLNQEIGLELKPAENLMSQTSSQSDFCHLSATLNILGTDLSKIADDLRFMASGPWGGIGEIKLANLQPGSSIMPGKVNPVIPEVINQMSFLISGYNLTIHQANTYASLELANMLPILADSLITTLKVLTTGAKIFREKCIETLEVDKEQSQYLLEKSTALATYLSPRLGYDKTSELVKEAIKRKITIKQLVLEKKLLTEIEFNQLNY